MFSSSAAVPISCDDTPLLHGPVRIFSRCCARTLLFRSRRYDLSSPEDLGTAQNKRHVRNLRCNRLNGQGGDGRLRGTDGFESASFQWGVCKLSVPRALQRSFGNRTAVMCRNWRSASGAAEWRSARRSVTASSSRSPSKLGPHRRNARLVVEIVGGRRSRQANSDLFSWRCRLARRPIRENARLRTPTGGHPT